MAAEDMNLHRANLTPVPSLILQSREVEPVMDFIIHVGDDDFDEFRDELRALYKPDPPPAGNDPVTMTTLTVRLITRIYERFYPCGLPKQAIDRLQAAITAAAAIVPDLAVMMADKDLELSVGYQEIRATGRRRLRKN